MPGSRVMPPRPTIQKGVRVTSTSRTGSQKPIDTPILGGLLQKHTGDAGLAISSCPSERMDADPIDIGNIQLQQMSVIGFMKRPWHVGPADAEGIISMAAMAAASNAPATMRLRKLINAQPFAFLVNQRGYVP